MRTLLRLAVATALLGEPISGQIVRDSASIEIVENGRLTWREGEAWKVGDTPSVQIGSVDGTQELLFSRVRSVVLGADGSIIVADGGSGQVRFFDSTGRYEGSYGSVGEGPGEFMSLAWIDECRDGQILAFDVRLQRVTEVGTTPAVTWPVRRGGEGPPLRQVRCMEGGLVGMRQVLPGGVPVPGPMRGLARIEFLRPGAEPPVAREVAGEDRYFLGSNLIPRPLGRRTVFASSGKLLAVGTQDEPSIALYNDRGAVRRLIRWPDPELAVRPDDIQAHVRGVLAASPSERTTAIRAMYRDHDFPSYLPAFGNLIFDELDNLWVERTQRPGVSGNTWRVFSPSGMLLGLLDLPERFIPMSISADHIAGVWRDELNVEYVWVLEIEKGGRTKGPHNKALLLSAVKLRG